MSWGGWGTRSSRWGVADFGEVEWGVKSFSLYRRNPLTNTTAGFILSVEDVMEIKNTATVVGRMNSGIEEIPQEIRDLFASDVRISYIKAYLGGWVAMAYKWPSPGTGVMYTRPEGRFIAQGFSYDRKRPHGRGPRLVGFSAKGGRLVSK